MTTLKKLLPFLILFTLLSVLGRELYSANLFSYRSQTETATEDLPYFDLPTLASSKRFTPSMLTGKVSLLNIWASWCSACNREHDMLMWIHETYPNIPIYGILYKDNSYDASRWLIRKGNPYRLVGDNPSGSVGIDLGIYGTPETFIINRKGKIIYKHVGILDRDTWENEMYPIIQKENAR